MNVEGSPSRKLVISDSADLKPLLGLTLLMIVIHTTIGFCIPWETEVVCNDDWAYSWSCQQWFDQNVFRLHPAAMAWGLPQIVVGNAASILAGNASGEVLRWAGLAIGIICVYVFYASLRLFGDKPIPAVGKSALLAVNPLIVPLSWSFMTDMMFLLLILIAVTLIGLTDRPAKPLILVLAGIAIGLVTLQRQYGLALLIVFLARPVVWHRSRVWATLVGGLVPFLFLAFVWRWLDQGGGNASGLAPRIALIFQTILDTPFQSTTNFCSAWLQGLALISLFWLPYELMTSRRRQPIVLFVCALAFLLSDLKLFLSVPEDFGFAALDRITWAHFYDFGLVGAGLHDAAILHQTRPGTPDIGWLFVLIHVVSLISGTFMLGRIIEALREASQKGIRHFATSIPVPLISFLLLLSVVVTISVLSKFFLFDRYLLICIALAGFLYHDKIRNKRLMLGLHVVFTLFLALLSIAGTIDYWQWSSARFKVVEQLIAEGVAPVDIDGGYGYHGLKTPVTITDDGKVDTEWETYWAGARRPYRIDFNPGGMYYREISHFPFPSPLYQSKDSMLHLKVLPNTSLEND